MSRKTQTDFPGAFRIVLVKAWGRVYKGPYQTLSAAKGQLTSETAYDGHSVGWIEKTPDGAWERVE